MLYYLNYVAFSRLDFCWSLGVGFNLPYCFEIPTILSLGFLLKACYTHIAQTNSHFMGVKNAGYDNI
jgi:hypothetical protein